MFEPFKQIDIRRNRRIQGTGLGLSISKNHLDLMDGSIEVASVYGEGSTFTIVMPKMEGNPDKVSKKNHQTGILYSEGVRILVVDDNEINLGVASGLLKTLHNVKADTAISGWDALDKAKTTEYTLIFMDHMMSGMDGVETTLRIRDLGGWNATVPIVALTANAIAGNKVMLLSKKMNDFLSKPIRKSELEEILYKWIPERYRVGQRDTACIVRTTSAKQSGEAALMDKLAAIDELDALAGLDNVADQQDVYVNSLKLISKKIPDICQMMSEQVSHGDLKSFSIHVHGMKSSLASVGAAELSKFAQSLEKASITGDDNYCFANLPVLVRQLRSLRRKIEAAFAEEAKASPDSVRIKRSGGLETRLASLHAALAGYDYDQITRELDSLRNADYGAESNAALAKIREAAELFDYQGAADMLMQLFPEVDFGAT